MRSQKYFRSRACFYEHSWLDQVGGCTTQDLTWWPFFNTGCPKGLEPMENVIIVLHVIHRLTMYKWQTKFCSVPDFSDAGIIRPLAILCFQWSAVYCFMAYLSGHLILWSEFPKFQNHKQGSLLVPVWRDALPTDSVLQVESHHTSQLLPIKS